MPAISARVLTIQALFELGRFQPATVQREYQWRESNCQALLSDLRRILDTSISVDAADDASAVAPAESSNADEHGYVPPTLGESEPEVRDYFLGTIVVRLNAPHSGEPQTSEPTRVDVYDGLQRLTTLTILLSVLRDFSKDAALAERLHALVALPATGNRLGLRLGHAILREEVQARGEARRTRRPRRKLTETDLRIRAATRYFWGQVGSWPHAQLTEFATRLLDHVSVGLIEVVDERIARQIFVSTNLHGVRLNRPDLFKGQLVEQATTPEVADEITRAWEAIVKIADDPGTRLAPLMRSPDANPEFAAKQVQSRDARGLDGLLQAVDFIERQKPQGVDCVTLLADHVAKAHPGDQVLGWLDTLMLRARAWRELHDRIETLTSREPVDVAIWKLRFFWWPEWKPLALLWYANVMARRAKSGGHVPPQAVAAFEERFLALHARCAALVLAGYDSTDLATIFRNAIKQEQRRQSPLTIALAFDHLALDKMRLTLTVPMTEKPRRVSIVQWLEASYWGDNVPEYVGSATVEHVLPQRARADSQWATTHFPNEDERYDCAQSLGNLAALDRPRNDALSNAEYPVKRGVYLKEGAPLFKTLAQVAAHEVWTPELIRRREAELVAHVFEQMNLPTRQR